MSSNGIEAEIAKPTTRGEACDEFDFVLLTLMRIWNDDNFPTSAQKLAEESRVRLEPIYSVLCSSNEKERSKVPDYDAQRGISRSIATYG